MAEIVVLKKCEEYDLEKVKKVLIEGLDLIGGVGAFVKKDEKVLLKVNSLMNTPVEKPACTHPVMLRAVIQILKPITKNIFVGDSPGVGTFEFCAKRNGLKEVIDSEGATLVNILKEEYELINKNPLKYRSFKTDPLIGEMDKIINLPRFKTHGLMYLTLCIKNMFGLIPGTSKPGYHLRAGTDKRLFSQMFIDIFNSRLPDLNILDGIIGMEGNGPGGGDPVNLKVILMGANGFAVDLVAPKIVGLNPYDVYINEVYRDDVLKGKELEVKVMGEKIEDVFHKGFKSVPRESFTKPGFFFKLIKGLITPKQIYIKQKCTGCLRCVQHCPVKCLEHSKKKGIKCDYNACIRCFICQEICPEDAIRLRKPLLSMFVRR